jgi:hypothetical protein
MTWQVRTFLHSGGKVGGLTSVGLCHNRTSGTAVNFVCVMPTIELPFVGIHWTGLSINP